MEDQRFFEEVEVEEYFRDDFEDFVDEEDEDFDDETSIWEDPRFTDEWEEFYVPEGDED